MNTDAYLHSHIRLAETLYIVQTYLALGVVGLFCAEYIGEELFSLATVHRIVNVLAILRCVTLPTTRNVFMQFL